MRLKFFLAVPLFASLVACGGGGESTPDAESPGSQQVQSGSRAIPGYTVRIERTETVVSVHIAADAGQPMPLTLAAWRGGDEYLDPAVTTPYTGQSDGSFTGIIPAGSGQVLWVRLVFADGSQMIAGRDAFTL